MSVAELLLEDLSPGDPPTSAKSERIDTSRFVHVGPDAYGVLRSAPEPHWLVPDLLRSGKATVLGGSTMTAKSWLALQAGSSIAAGYPVWPGGEGKVSEGVAVFIGYDPHMTVEDVTRRLDHLDRGEHRRDQAMPPRAWEERFVSIGHSEQTGAFPIDRYRLDAEGCERIAEEILRPIERDRGPILTVTIDTLSTALPIGIDENDNAAMTAVVSRLSGLALDFRAAALAVHHPTKANSSAGGKFQSWDPLAYFRGASAIPSAAGVLAGLWAPQEHPQHRVLTCWSNSGRRRRTWFLVTSDPDRGAQGMVDMFWPVEPPGDASSAEDEGAAFEDLARAFPDEATERLSMREFTRRSQNAAMKKEPSGRDKKAAEKLRAWALTGNWLTREEDGARRLFLTSEGMRALAPFRRGGPRNEPAVDAARLL